MFIAIVFFSIISTAFAACPAKPDLVGGFVCSYGSSSKTGEWAQYCCYTGNAPKGNLCKITCSDGKTWAKPKCSCTPDNVCGAYIPPKAPYSKPKSGSQCKGAVKTPPTRCLADKAAALIPVSKNEVIQRHNCWRKNLNPPAAEALTPLKWDDELAVLAERWAAQCPSGHDKQADRTLPKRITNDVSWNWVGQNICYASFNQTWSGCVDAWAGEQKDFIFGKGSNGKGQTGHYTQVVAERSLFVGCGMAYCPKNPTQAFVQVCNYGPGGNFNGGQNTPYTLA